MGEAYITRRGSNPLNFKVVGGTTAPTNPKENTIWVNTDVKITSWQFASDDPNLLDFNNWANNISVSSGTKSVSGNAITLTANANDCYTAWVAAATSAVIPCETGKTYVFEWNHSGSHGSVHLFPNASVQNLVSVDASAGIIEYTATEGVTFFTFRVGVAAANTTATYSNIRITKKERAFAPGAVWISTGTTSPFAFNALKKNSLMVCPISAKQYISGAWVDKPAKSYQNGAWSNWTTYLYNNGDEYNSLTGGWDAVGVVYTADSYGSYGGATPTMTKNATNITGTATKQSGYIHTKNKIDLSPYKTLKFNGSMTAVQSRPDATGITIRENFSGHMTGGNIASNLCTSTGSRSGEFTIDISALNGSYYVCLAVGDYGGATATIVMNSLTLEA